MKRSGFVWCVLGVLGASPVFAMQAISDTDLAATTGQSGLTYVTSSNTLLGGSSSVLQWNPDAGNSKSATLEVQGLQFNGIGGQGVGIGASGSSLSGPFSVTTNFDVGSKGSTPALAINSSWTQTRVLVPTVLLLNASGTASTYGYGSVAMDSSGSLNFTNVGGLLNGSKMSPSTQLYLTLGSPQIGMGNTAPGSYGQIYYRQGGVGSPEMIIDKLYMATGFNPQVGGVFGACGTTTSCGGTAAGLAAGGFASGSTGLYLGSPKLDFNMTYVLAYRPSPSSTGFTTATSGSDVIENLGTFGWTGSFDNAELLLSSGGMWADTGAYDPLNPSGRSQGLNIDFHANYDPNFNWVIGDGSGQEVLDFGGWKNLTGATWGLNVPNLTMDVVNANQGVGGLCWGAQSYGVASGCTGSTTTWVNGGGSTSGSYLDLEPTSTALGLAIRDMSLQAYSTTVTLSDYLANSTRSFNWGLMYTLGQVDGNLYLYPGNSTGTGNGLTADVLFMSQSFANNAYPLLNNTNFMIVDTNTNLGFGLAQANLLLAAHQLAINLTTAGIQLSSPDMRMEVQGVLGGGPVYSMTSSSFEKMMYVDVNLESNNFSLTLSQGTQNGLPYLAYTGHMTLADTTQTGSTIGVGGNANYISLAEPSDPGASFMLSNITGDINVVNGQIFLISAADTVDAPDGIPRLQLANTIQVGSTAGGQALTADVKFGGAQLATIAIPSGQIYSSIMLKPQH